MGKLIKLGDCLYVAADQVAEIHPNYHQTFVIVKMKDGHIHEVPKDYGEALYSAVDRLVKLVNDALDEE